MKSIEILTNRLASLRDSYNHYTMVDKDKDKAFWIKNDIEETEILLNELSELKRLKDIEKELGCPLEVVFKGMSDYVVEYKANNEIAVGLISSIFKGVTGKWYGSFILKKYILGKRDYYTTNIELNQYSKIWWLKGEKENV